MLNFDFLEGFRKVFSLNFEYDFSRKMFVMFYFNDWPNLIVWLPLFSKILDNMYIVIIC